MKVLLTGATGLLGSNIAQKLLEKGYQVKALVRPKSNKIALKDLAITYFFGDITDEKAVIEAAKDCEIVIHAAANTLQNADNKQYENDNLIGTKNIVKASQVNRASRLLYISTAGFFKSKYEGQIANEHDVPTVLSIMNRYTQSKFAAQELIINELKNSSLPAIILNPSFMIGQRDAKPSSGQILLFYLKNNWIFCPKGGKNFVDVEDVALATVNAITQGKIGESYILGNQNLSYQAFFEKVAQVIGRSKPKILIPNTILTNVGRVGSIYNKLFNKNLQLDYQNSKVLTQNYFYDTSKAVRELALPQTPIEQAIENAIKWFAENKNLNLKLQ